MQGTSIHLANVVGAAFAGSQYFFSIRKKVRQNKQRQTETYRIVLDKLMWQKGNKQRRTHSYTHTLCPLLSHLPNLILYWTAQNQTKAAHLSLSLGIIQMKPMNLSISKCFSKFIICNCRWNKKIELDKRYYDIV